MCNYLDNILFDEWSEVVWIVVVILLCVIIVVCIIFYWIKKCKYLNCLNY